MFFGIAIFWKIKKQCEKGKARQNPGSKLQKLKKNYFVSWYCQSQTPRTKNNRVLLLTLYSDNTVNSIKGNVTAKVWVYGGPNYGGNPEPDPLKYVNRHYQIVPEANTITTTGRVTLYFTQYEFDHYNGKTPLNLP